MTHSDEARSLADLLLPDPRAAKPPVLRKAKVTSIFGTTFTAQIEGAATPVPGLAISKPFQAFLAVNSVVWLLNSGPVYLLVHQES